MLDPAIYSPAKLQIITSQVVWNLTFIVLACIVLVFVHRRHRRLFTDTIVLLLVIDLFLFATGNLFTAPVHLFNFASSFNPGLSRYLSTADTSDYSGLHVYWNHLRVRQPFAPDLSSSELQNYSRFQQELNLYPSNLNLIHRWFTASGYAATVLESYAIYLNSTQINSVSFPDLSDSKIKELGVNYFVTGFPTDFVGPSPNLIPISSNPTIYKTTTYFPRAKFVSDKGIAHIASYLPHRVTISTQNSIPNTLVLSDSIYPGWKATIDDQPVPIHPYLHTFRSVDVPSGSHTVTFSYHPTSVKIGAIISLGTGILFVAVALIKPKHTLFNK